MKKGSFKGLLPLIFFLVIYITTGIVSGEFDSMPLPTLMMGLQPLAGGLVLASIMAAILSTVTPIILASGTMATKDIYQKLINKDATDEELLKVSRLTTGLSGVICILG